eukprot:TRINITY_DN34796_c0_g1_i1.p1 TRINITY_DN34796_c0_g1~~TRINITY_DN34796_c0_g1_i1.p1  ORF type:complete len:629 (+),score=241.92 TRINITY_DN34796_c0_g1_i1:34-1887(+)
METAGVPAWEGSFVTGTPALRVIHDTKRTELTLREHEAGRVVAKRFRMCDEEALTRYEAELSMLCKLSSSSTHFVRPVAHITQPPTFAVVLPFFAHGSMDTVLHNPKYARLDWPLRMLFCTDIALAVAHCHKHNVIIRDVKPGNMLVDAKLNAVMSDLELAKTEEDIGSPTSISYNGPSSRRKTRFEGTPEFMAPELLKAPGSQLQRGIVVASKSTDVYAVGISLMEVATSQVPYTDVEMTTEQLHTVVETRYSPTALHQAIVEEGLRPNTTDRDAAFKALAVACWAQDPAQRPDISEVLETLQRIAPSPDTDRAQYLEIDEAAGKERLESLKKQVVRDWPDVLRSIAQTPPDGRAGVLPKTLGGAAEGTAGRRDMMEDDWFLSIFHDQGRSSARVYGMLDGHGGAGCAKFVKKELPPALEHELLMMEGVDVRGAITRAFDTVQQMWEKSPDADESGACCTIALILESHVWIAWCGDCSAVGSRAGSAVVFTSDHSPESAAEKRRIEAAGGKLVQTSDGKWRVNGKIAVSRAFGDRSQPLVSHKPDIVHYALRSMDEILILASDGVWDVCTPASVVEALQGTVRHRDYGAKRVCCDAYNAGSTDNIGAVVIYFDEQA